MLTARTDISAADAMSSRAGLQIDPGAGASVDVLHVLQLSFLIDQQNRPAETLLRDWRTLIDVAEAASIGGARVTLIQASLHSEYIRLNGVDVYLLQPDEGAHSISDSKSFALMLKEIRADVIHVQGLGFSADLARLSKLAPHTPIFLQDHAEKLPRLWRRNAWRRGVAKASGISFCARAQAERFVDAKLIRPDANLFEIPECPSRFAPGDREEARQITGLSGDPCLLWVAHLDKNKDPLTVLEGVAIATERLPGIKLWCCYRDAPLLADVRALVAADSRLTERVRLIGRVKHEQVEYFMRATDYFLQGSYREGSGYAAIEALACGATPIVTDIPSFRALGGHGAVARLWKCGDPQSLADTLVHSAAQDRDAQRVIARRYFEAELSLAAVGRKLVAAYRKLVATKYASETAV